jgi:hypothetical protein
MAASPVTGETSEWHGAAANWFRGEQMSREGTGKAEPAWQRNEAIRR